MKKVLTAVTAAVLALICFVSCAGTQPEDTLPENTETEAVTEAVTEPVISEIQLTSGGKSLVTVVRPDNASQDVIDQAVEVRKKLSNVIGGITVNMGNDFLLPNKTHDAEKTEILIGKTNYDETQSVLSEMYYQDYCLKTVGHKIVVTAPSDERLTYAITKLTTLLSKNVYKDENGDYWLKPEDFSFSANYKVKKLTLAGIDFSKYVIVYQKSGTMLEAAEAVQSTLATATGVEIPIVTDKEKESAYEILIGTTSRLEVSANITEYNVYFSGNKLVFACKGMNSASAAVKKLYTDKLSIGGEIDIDSSLSLKGLWNEDEGTPLTEGADVRIMSFNILKESYATGAGWDTPTSPRGELLANVLEKYRPDAVGIQEADALWIRAINYYCGDYKPCCTALANGTENYSNIIYDSSRYDLIKTSVTAYSTSDNKSCRNIAWALLENKTTKKQFILISTHWDLTEAPRVAQAQELAATVNALAAEYKIPVFSTGDYNARQDSTPIATYRSLNNMWCSYYDAEKYYNRYGSCSSFGTMSSVGGGVIDYVFATKSNTKMLASMTVINCQTQYISDHRPVIADIKYTD